jgi:hypothetical protein
MENAKKQMINFKKTAKESTINTYIRSLEQLTKYMSKKDLDYLQDADLVLNFMDTMKNKVGDHITDSTKKSYLNAIIVYLQSQDTPNENLIKEYLKPRDQYNEKYAKAQKDSKISEKQKPNFANMDELQQLLDNMKQDIKQKKLFQKDNLNRYELAIIKAYIMFHFLIDLPIRNDLAGIKLIGKREYNTLSDDDKKKDNYIINSRPNFLISLGDYKTNKLHGIKLWTINKKNEVLLKKWFKIMDIKKKDVIFDMSRTDLSNLLINQSKKYLGKRISTTMIRKARASVNVESKKDQENLADIMTHKVGTHAEIYTKEL